MIWADWICSLATSLEVDEMERYERYVLSGGKPEKFPWRYRVSAELSSGASVMDQVLSGWQGAKQSTGMKGTLEEAADRGFVKRAGMTADGKYVDESGNVLDVPPPGYFFVRKPTQVQ
jgi:hypothetical protein